MNPRHIHAALLGIAAALAIAAGPAAEAAPVANEFGPNLVANGGFETSDFSGWSTSISLFSGVDGAAAHDGAYGVFAGEIGSPGTIGQSLSTVAGTLYNIHFWLRSDGLTPNDFFVRWNGATVFDASDLGAFDYTEFVIDPAATGAASLLEIGFRNDNGFLEFDDVSVRASVPEPASLALLGVGLLGLGWARRSAGPVTGRR